MEKEQTTLKTCPHCGAEAKLLTTSGGKMYLIECQNCKIATLAYPDKELAVQVWNNRA